MKKVIVVVALLLLLAATVHAREMAGIEVPETASISGQALQLNGCGIRKKFFFSIYLGALYTSRPVSSLEECRQAPGNKLIRMTFLYKKVEREKIVNAFAQGFEKNSPELSRPGEVGKFLSFFTDDFLAGEVVELELCESGTVVARHNGRVLGELNSRPLAQGILAIYLGEHPADEDLKSGMLGLNL